MTNHTDDALQRRIARFIADAPARKACNHYLWMSIATDIGQVRKDNQDRAIAITASYSHAPEKNFTLGVICDGMGGMVGGSSAASIALSVFASQVIRTSTVPPYERLERAAREANEAVYKSFHGRGGTTLSAVLITGELRAHIVNIGDSRIYGVSKDKSLVLLTRDDTLAEHIKNQEMLFGQQNRLLQFVGMGEDLEPHTDEFYTDEYLYTFLSSDGIHGVNPSSIKTVVYRSPDTTELSRRLLLLSEASGGTDNATIVCIDGAIKHRPASEQGVTLTLISPCDRLEIWIPRPSDEARSERLPDALRDATRTSDAQLEHGYLSKSKKRSRGRRKHAQVKIKGEEQNSGDSAEERAERSAVARPELDMKFSSDKEG